MPQLKPIELQDGMVIFIETEEDILLPEIKDAPMEEPLVSKDGMDVVVQKFQPIEAIIVAFTAHTMEAFKKVASVNVDKVTLEFGIKLGGEAGIPYVAKGTAESNLKITVESSFLNRRAS